MRRLVLLITFLLSVGVSVVRAQCGEAAIAVRVGHNAMFGPFAAFSGVVRYEVKDCFALRGGAQYSTIGRTAVELRPQYFHDFGFGRLSGELLLHYANLNRLNNFAIGVGASLDIRYVWLALGYYFRSMTLAESNIGEPFNIYYELGIRCLPKREKWNLNVVLSNSQLLELERHYQPSLSLEGWWYPMPKLGVQLGLNYKPAGMFNITSDYYQFFADLGVCYRW